jgi:hypothetical protein
MYFSTILFNIVPKPIDQNVQMGYTYCMFHPVEATEGYVYNRAGIQRRGRSFCIIHRLMLFFS